MLASIFTKSLRDRWVGEVVGAASIALLLVFTMAIYADIDTSFYYELPAAVLDAVGINPDLGGLSGIAYGSIYNLMGALVVAGIAISIGASSVAGEERDGTLGVLLGNPRSRTDVLAAKVGAMVLLTVLGTAVLWAGGELAPVVLGVDASGVRVGALAVHLGANAVFWGMVATAIGAWTGNRTAASGGAAAAMVGSYLAATLLPLFPAADGVAQVAPWYWFSGSTPEANGIHVGHLALLVGGAVVLGVVAWVGVNRRDLRDQQGRVTFLDRLRTHPLTQRYADRVAGSTRVSSITAKATSDQQGLLVIVAGILFMLSLYYGPIYNLLPPAFTEALAGFPDTLMAMIGQADMSTAAGWLQAELFSLTIPIGMVTVLASVGAKSLAGEEAARTMEVLLANPVARRHVLLAKAGALVVYAVVLGVATFVGVTIGVLVGGLGVPVANLAAATALGTLLGLGLGAVAFVVGAATGRSRPAIVAATGVAVLSYFAWSFLPLSPSLAGWANLSPFDWYLGGDPLAASMPWGDAALLVGLTVVLVAVAIPLFERRDLRG